MFDFSDIKIIDNHCHPFSTNREKSSYERYWSISLLPQPPFDTRRTVIFQMVMKKMAEYLGMDKNSSFYDIIAKRNEVYRADRKKYVQGLMNSANIDKLIVDFGFLITGERLVKEEIDEFMNLTEGTEIGYVIRVAC